MNTDRVDVLIVGAGPAGLAAATALADAGEKVLVLDREAELGGIPRHASHVGYGIIDLRRVLTGPGYARHYVRAAERAGAALRSETTALSWAGERTLLCTSPRGRFEITARAIVLATGCRERPRAARLVPGSRPGGVFTTGSLQQYVHSRGLPVGTRAVIVGAEHVSFSAVMTLRRADVRVVAMVDEQPRHQTYAPISGPGLVWLGCPDTERAACESHSGTPASRRSRSDRPRDA